MQDFGKIMVKNQVVFREFSRKTVCSKSEKVRNSESESKE